MSKTGSIRTAAIIAILGNAFLAVLKVSVGLYSSSKALLGDGIDSSTDVLIAIITLAVVGIMSKPADVKHPFGHRKAESIATAFMSFVIFFAGAQLIINAGSNIINDAHTIMPSAIPIVVTAISIVGKVLLALSQFALSKRANSSLLRANAKNMLSDVFISVGVIIGFIVSIYTGSGHVDSIVAVFVGLWIIKTAFGIFTEVNLELMDGNNDSTPYRAIVEAVSAVGGASNPHRARVRSISGFWDIEFDIDVNPNSTVLEAHFIVTQIENEIKQRLENVFDIMIHIEPQGEDAQEAFGLSEDDMRSKLK